MFVLLNSVGKKMKFKKVNQELMHRKQAEEH